MVSFLTDFGPDGPAAICRGVILGIVRDAAIVDLAHGIRKYAIRDGALLLWCALPYLPVGVHVAVVDPGVGTARRPIALRAARGDVLVGPDNGLLLPGAGRLGGVVEVVELAEPDFRLPVVSSSFHGRDIFAPAAAHVAAGVALERLGPRLDPADLVDLGIPDPEVRPGAMASSVVYVDTFGNVKLAGTPADLAAALGPVSPGDRLRLTVDDGRERRRMSVAWRSTFGEAAVGEPLVYEDSYGRLCVAVNQGAAATALGLVEDAGVLIERA